MKKFPKLLQADSRGQIVIPKEIRRELGIDETTGFFAYTINDEGIFLKKVETKPLSDLAEVKELKEKAEKIGISKKNVEKAEGDYKKNTKGGFEQL
jgi:AbrB family looped-hinge helix DNA binding protein